ncbi:hypothetical protein, partial [Streptomyces galilaeus]|uniref:hypothetical protein n=1 Tax=Streptomyces galilaeus TaxID=33899 RepID=UPI0038F621F2
GTGNGLTKLNTATSQSQTFLSTEDKKSFFGEFAVFDVTDADLGKPNRYLWLLVYDGLALFDKKTQRLSPIKSHGLTQSVINQRGSF